MELESALSALANNPNAPLDLAELALTLARDEYPRLDVEAYLAEMEGLAHEARGHIRGGLEARVRGLCRYLFHDLGFRGNQKEYYDPRNSYFNEVLDRRTGLPILLSAVAMAIGRRVGLEIAGVGLPGHFVAKAVEGDEEILFDPFHGGRLLTPDQCEGLVRRVVDLPFEATPETLCAVPLGCMVLRMLTNLKGSYLRKGDFNKGARVISRLCQLCPDNLVERRDLGATLLKAGRPGEAIDFLEAYVACSPNCEDEKSVAKLLDQARGLVARWN
jgi:regulator of sirC expression with transglutaminase-like and TPR domain